MLTSDLRRLFSVVLVFTMTVITMPVSAADFSTTRTVIGSVSAVGPVDLRGVQISQEGTLFAGDSIRAHERPGEVAESGRRHSCPITGGDRFERARSYSLASAGAGTAGPGRKNQWRIGDGYRRVVGRYRWRRGWRTRHLGIGCRSQQS